jgi:hypothetical protein
VIEKVSESKPGGRRQVEWPRKLRLECVENGLLGGVESDLLGSVEKGLLGGVESDLLGGVENGLLGGVEQGPEKTKIKLC